MAHWFKCFPRELLLGMLGLSEDAQLAYVKALLLIYEDETPVAPLALARELYGWRRPRMERAVQELVAMGKLGLDAQGRLFNQRATFELAQLHASTQERSEAGRKGGRARVARERKAAAGGDLFNGQQQVFTGALQPQSARNTPTIQPDYSRTAAGLREEVSEKPSNINGTTQAQLKHARAPDIDIDIDKEETPLTPPVADLSEIMVEDPPEPSRKRSRRAMPMPPGWEPAPLTDKTEAMVRAWDEGEVEHELQKFTAYAEANGRTCKDWDAAWRGWLLNAEQYRKQRRNRGTGQDAGWRFTL